MTDRLVVIGGDAAGMSAASQARRRKSAEELEIVAFERGHFTSYSACGVPYFVGGAVEELDELIVRRPEEFRERQAIDARIRREVTAIDLDARRVTVRDLEEGGERQEPFDQLMVASGAVPLRPPLPGIETAGVFGVQTLDDGVAIEKAVEETDPKKAVVVGAGYIGLEMAEALVMRGLDVVVVEMEPAPLSTLDPDMGDLVSDAIRGLGIALYTGEGVSAIEGEEARVSAVITAERELPADIVVLGLGVQPNVDFARAAGIPVGDAGGIAVDDRMATSVDGVWSAGDCAEKFHRISRRAVTIPLGTHANKEGRVAGINIGGGRATFPGVVGTAASKICDLEVARTGVNEREARAADFDFVAAKVSSTTRAGYFPGTKPLDIKVLAERGSGRLLGAQIVGREGAAKRIDVFASALWNDMTVDELMNVDLSYAPPFAPVWDPVLIAARKAAEAIESDQAKIATT